MKKLEKKNSVIVDSLETYVSCICSCSCGCYCSTCGTDYTLYANISNTNNQHMGSSTGGQSSYSIQQVTNGD